MKPRDARAVERNDEIVALLEERPYTTGELAEIFELATGMNQILIALSRSGRIDRLRDHRWCLPRHPEPGAAVEHGPVKRVHIERQPPADPKALRHLHERPPTVRVARDAAPSWWVGKDRARFNADIEERQLGVRDSKEPVGPVQDTAMTRPGRDRLQAV